MTPPTGSPHSVLMITTVHIKQKAFITEEDVSLKRYFLIYVSLSHHGVGVEAGVQTPLIPDNILSIGLRC